MTREERALIEKVARGGLPGFLDEPLQLLVAYIGLPILGASLGALFGVCLELLFGSHLVRNISIGIGLSSGLTFGLMGIRQHRKVLLLMHQDLSEETVEILHCTANEALRLETGTCPGEIGFFLNVGDSKVLFLQGEYLYDLEDQQRFPNCAFDVTRAPHSGIVLGVVPTGEPLMSTRVMKLSGRSRRALGNKDMLIFPGNLSSLESDLEKLKST